ncbi:hypothetical protein [Mesotoga sp.]|uniref:hypothetical protein n=1 Tax=Mesotoga sp. TaxID=2053577 RepID=UPI00345EA9C5
MNYYAYVRDDERDDCDYPCRLCSRFESGLCNLLEMKVDEDDVACEYFEMADEYLGKTRAEID